MAIPTSHPFTGRYCQRLCAFRLCLLFKRRFQSRLLPHDRFSSWRILWGATLTLLLLLALVAVAAEPPHHSRLLYEADLQSATANPIGSITNTNGQFIAGKGWTAKDETSQLRIDLNDYLPFEATVEITISNLDPYTQLASQKDRTSWTPISLWSRPQFGYGSLWKTAASFFYFLSEKNAKYNDQGKSNWKVISSAYYGYGAYNNLGYGDFIKSEPDPNQAMKYDLNKEYTFKLVCSNGLVWVLLNDVVFKEHIFNGQLEGFNHIVLGANLMGPSILGPTFKNLRIYIPESPVSFQNVAQSSGMALDKVYGAAGIAWADVNRDGLEDAFIPFAKSIVADEVSRLYLQQPSHHFVEAAASSGLAALHNATQAVFSDLDRDGYPDLLLVKDQHLLLYHNQAAVFSDQTSQRGLAQIGSSVVQQVLHLDSDGDGDQDLFIVATPKPMLFINDGKGQFTLADRGISSSLTASIDGAAAGDVNLDGATDLVILPLDQAPILFLNDKKGHFTAESSSRGFNKTFRDGLPLLHDLDRDGDLDLFILKKQTEISTFYQNNGSGFFSDQTTNLKLTKSPLLLPLDADNDSYTDYWRFVPNSTNNTNTPHSFLAFNQKNNSFITITNSGSEANYAPLSGQSCVDFDQDGKLDIIAISAGAFRTEMNEVYGRSALYHNITSPATNHYLQIAFQDTSGGPLCTDAAVSVYPAGKLGDKNSLLGYQDLAAAAAYASPMVHFGVGSNTVCDIVVRFATGATLEKKNIPVDQRIIIIRPTRTPGPTYLRRLSPEATSGKAGDLTRDSLKVQVLDHENQPVAGHTVTFAVLDNRGTLADGVAQISISTDSQGISRTAWRLSTVSGVQNRVSVQAFDKDNKALEGSPMFFSSQVFPAADTTLHLIKGNEQTGLPGQVLSDSIVVRVQDHYGNPHGSAIVRFTVASGGGTLEGASQRNLTTDPQGRAAATWTLGSVLGKNSQSLIVQILSGQSNQLTVLGGTLFGIPDPQRSFMQSSPTVTADGKSLIQVAITVLDAQGIPVVGERVQVQVNGEGVIVSQPEQLTDSQGRTTAGIRSTKAGSFTISTSLPMRNMLLGSTATIFFSPGPAKFLRVIAGNSQIGTINHLLISPIKLQATDSLANPVADLPIFFETANKCGQVDPPGPASTLSDGTVTVRWRLGETIGRQTMMASVKPMVAALVEATAKLPAVSLQSVQGDGQVALPAAYFQDSLSVQIRDDLHSPVAGVPVKFSLQSGDVILGDSRNLSTDSNGRASLRLLAGIDRGPVIVKAAVDDSLTSQVTFHMAVVEAMPDSLVPLTALSNTIHPGTEQTVAVKVVDLAKKTIAQVPVFFSSTSSAISITESQPIYSDHDGVAQIRTTMPLQIGAFDLQAHNKYIKGSAIHFAFKTVSSAPAGLQLLEGDSQSAFAEQWLIQSLKVKVVDGTGAGVAGLHVRFTVQSGGGSLTAETLVTTNAAGIASSLWKLGSQGEQTVRANCEELAGHEVIFHATLLRNAPPLIQVCLDTSIVETQTLVLPVKASDAENDLFTLTARNLPPGATFNENQIIWTPNLDQQGIYLIRIIATDATGSTDSTQSRIRVINLNRIPHLQVEPDSTSLVLRYYRPYRFKITANDPDQDSLHVLWRLDGQTASHGNQFELIANPSMGSMIHLEVMVSDSQDSIKHSWTLRLTSAVSEPERLTLPTRTRLAQNYPNPFNPTTTLFFENSREQEIKIDILTLSGQRVKTLFQQRIPPGAFHLDWDGRDDAGHSLASGIYFCVLASSEERQMIKITLLK